MPENTETPAPSETPAEETPAVEERRKKSFERPASPAASPLQRPTDAAERPGFRSASNTRSKASRKKRKKRR